MSTKVRKFNLAKKVNIRKITVTAIFGALASVLMMLSFSVPFMPSFIKMDLSEFPALIASFSMGPLSGIAVCFIKNAVNVFATTTGGVGELSNFLLGVSFVVPAGLIYKHMKTRKGALIGSVVGSLAMSLLSLPINYLVTYPIYINALGFPLIAIIGMYQEILPGVDGLLMCLIVFNMPFTFLKGALDAVATFLIYKRISPIIREK